MSRFTLLIFHFPQRFSLLLGAMLFAFIVDVFGQKPMTRDEKLAQKVRIAYLQAIGDLKVPTITVDSAIAHLGDTNVVFIDVREDKEITVSKIPGALSPAEFAAAFRHTGLPKEKTIVTYCTLGFRSGKYAEPLLAKGLRVKNLEGGLLAWAGAQGPLLHRDKDGLVIGTREVHVYDKEWNLLPPNYKAVW